MGVLSLPVQARDVACMLGQAVKVLQSVASGLTKLRNGLRRVRRLLRRLAWWLLLRMAHAADFLLAPRLVIRLVLRHSLALVVLSLLPLAGRFATQLLKRLLRIRPSAEHVRLVQHLRDASTYAEWKTAAAELDALEGLDRWRLDERSPHYDYPRVGRELAKLYELVASRRWNSLMRYLRRHAARDGANCGDARLHFCARSGTKQLIDDHIEAQISSLRALADAEGEDAPSTAEKLRFFDELRHAFGHTALCLSGGGTLGLLHIGVVEALLQEGLLPRLISGSSAGALIGALVATKTDAELLESLQPGAINLSFFPDRRGSVWRRLRRLWRRGHFMNVDVLRDCLRDNIGDQTFAEAYQRTGRILNITVSTCDRTRHGQPRLLNFLTAPDVVIWSAALASCAVPLVYPPVALQCRRRDGRIRPFLDAGTQFADGSVEHDLPMTRLSELFNVNHFLVSQVNPHVLPFVVPHSTRSSASGWQRFLSALFHFVSRCVKELSLATVDLCGSRSRVAADARALFSQRYEGDVTFVPKVTWNDVFHVL